MDSFSVPHDAVEPLGFVMSCRAARLGVLSDIGHVTHVVRERLRGVHTLFIESNYDEKLLETDTRRPWATKQRISSRHGHLSNRQTAELVGEIAHAGLARVILGHLSKDCNDPDLAARCVREALHGCGRPETEVHCACQRQPTPHWRVTVPAPAISFPAMVGLAFQGEFSLGC